MHFFTDTGHNFYVHIQKFLDTILRIHKYINAFYGILFNFLQITRNLISLIHVLKISFTTPVDYVLLTNQTLYTGNHGQTIKVLTDHLNHVLAVHPTVLEAWFFQLRYLCVEGQTGLWGDVASSQVMTP